MAINIETKWIVECAIGKTTTNTTVWASRCEIAGHFLRFYDNRGRIVAVFSRNSLLAAGDTGEKK